MALIRRIWRDLQIHARAGTPFRKPGKLTPYDVALRPERAPGKRQPYPRVSRSARKGAPRCDHKAEYHGAPHAPSSRYCFGKSRVAPGLR